MMNTKTIIYGLVGIALVLSPLSSTAQSADACPNLQRTLRFGMSGSDVSALQRFLGKEGYFFMEPTGFFGRVTEGALQSWQAAVGIVSSGSPQTTGWGVAGPKTRAVIHSRCDVTTTPEMLRASPQRGEAPLNVTFSARIPAGSTEYRIEFGDGSNAKIPPQRGCSSIYGGRCPDPSVSHTYAEDGTYTARLMYQPPWSCNGPAACPTVMPQEREVDTAVVRVGESSAGLVPTIVGVDGPSSLEIGETGVWNVRVSDQRDDLKYSVSWGDELVLTQIEAFAFLRPSQSSATFMHAYERAGTYSPRFNVTNAHGTASKSLQVAVGTLDFRSHVFFASPQSGSTPLTVTFTFYGPYVLGSPQGTPKSYRVDFGDGTTATPVDCIPYGYRQCTIQHTYTRTGTYTARLIDPGGCATDAPGCLGSPASEVAHTVVSVGVNFFDPLSFCPSDAKQCPDGTYVERTAPDCRFDCRLYGGN
ncbi:MAG TPA: PKD domain-containing protein [Candidatus Paceibacterota bacterium]